MSEQAGWIQWQAHRGGGAHEAPDNTMAANRYAWELGGIPEADLRTTKDGVVICLHDATLARTTNAPDSIKDRPVAELTYAEIRKWDAGKDFGERFREEKVPSLAEVFAEMRGRPERRMYLDLKDADPDQLGRLIDGYGVNDQVIFAHHQQDICGSMKRIAAGTRSMLWIGGDPGRIKANYEAARNAGFAGLDQVQLHLRDKPGETSGHDWRYELEPEFLVRALNETRTHGVDLEVFPFDFDERSMHRLLGMGIGWFATDEPARFLQCTQSWRERPTILLTAPFYEEDLRELRQFGSVVYRPWKLNGRAHAPTQVLQLIREAGAEALIVEHDVVTAEVLEATNLRWIGVCRGTPSNVDTAAAERLGIPVYVTPARNAQAVTEYVIGELIAMMRKVDAGKDWLKRRQWTDSGHESYLQHRGSELAGKTVGLVGLGGVGRNVARFLKFFGCRIQYYDPYLRESPDTEYVSASLDALFETSDIVSVHLPVTDETVGMIDRRLLRLMKPGAILVNSARAAVVERDSLIEALKEGRIGGAILDVFYQEPPDASDYGLIDLPNVSATPHIAGNTHEVDRYHARMMLEAIRAWYGQSDETGDAAGHPHVTEGAPHAN